MNCDELTTRDNSSPNIFQEQLQKLREENARLKSLLTEHGIPWEETSLDDDVQQSSVLEAPAQQLTKSEKSHFSAGCFVGVPMCIQSGGNQPKAGQDTLQLVAVNGNPVFARNRR